MKYIYGLKKSGFSILKYFINNNISFSCWDDNVTFRRKAKLFYDKIQLVNPKDIDFKSIEEAYITPGISLNDKKLKIFKKNKIKLFRDLELYSQITKNKKIISITGTNGKSTTTKLIGDLIKLRKKNIFIGGNIGIPLLDFDLVKYNNTHVIELSSFQLESAPSFDPTISILLSISSDHLDRYRNLKEYIKQKEKIFNFTKNSFNIISVNNNIGKKLYNKNINNQMIPISSNYIKKGLYLKDSTIFDNYFNKNKKIKISNFSDYLLGNFNKENILTAYVVAKILKLSDKDFKFIIKNFIGLPHRFEYIKKTKNIKVINNSKSTNVDSAIKSLEGLENIILILGGKAKENNFLKFKKYAQNIKKIYVIGSSKILIYNQLKKYFNIKKCDNLEIVFNYIKKDQLTINKYTLILSPGCTSLDQYENFEKRGAHFKKLVKKFLNT